MFYLKCKCHTNNNPMNRTYPLKLFSMSAFSVFCSPEADKRWLLRSAYSTGALYSTVHDIRLNDLISPLSTASKEYVAY